MNLTALSAALVNIARGASPEPELHGCAYDNYLTRVFASACLVPPENVRRPSPLNSGAAASPERRGCAAPAVS